MLVTEKQFKELTKEIFKPHSEKELDFWKNALKTWKQVK